MAGLRVEIHEPINVLSTMLLAIGPPRNTKLHPIAAKALEYLKPFAGHASLAWLKEFYRAQDLHSLYGHAAQLSGPLTFFPRSLTLPMYLAPYEPSRMRALPGKMTDFYRDTKLGTFRRQVNPEYTLAIADVKDALDNARIEEFLARLYGNIPYQIVAVPVPTHPFTGVGTGALTASEDYVFLHPPRVSPVSADPVGWSVDPERTQMLAQRELSRGLFYDATRRHKDLGGRLGPVLRNIPSDAPFARSYPTADLQVTELFLRASSASYLRHTRGDEAASRWLDGQIQRTGTPVLRSFFLAIEEFLSGARWTDLDGFLSEIADVVRG